MTRDELSKLLEMLCATYPNARIKDAAQTLDAWEMNFAEYPAETVYKATRLHMETCKFFPSPADIFDLMVKAQIKYSNTPHVTAIPAAVPLPDEEVDEYLDAVCEWIGFGCEENDAALTEFYEKHPEMLPKMRRIYG